MDTHAPPHSPAEWLAHIADLLGAEASGLVTLRPDGSHHLIAEGLDERAIAEYRDYYCRLDPLPVLLAERPAGRALVIDTTTHPAYATQRELSARYLRPHGIGHVIAAQWRQPDGSLRIVGVQRFRGSAPYSIADGKELDRFIHHWRVGNALPPPQGFAVRSGGGAEARRNCDIAAQLGIPLVVVDTHLALVWANPAAREEPGSVWTALLDGRSKHPAEFAIRRHLLELVLACLRQRAEAEALVQAVDGTWFAHSCPLAGKPGLALLRLTAVHRLGHGIRGRLQRLFGLTLAEADMTALLAQGHSLEAIAMARRVSVDTVRSQLRTVFRKTGMHRQGELVCAVGRLAEG
jgi:DNA-binding CsgD family transcriptional regulator